MRSFGSLRGNPTLRSMVQQTARRRMYATILPAPDSDERNLTNTREFFERLHDTLLPSMAHVDDTPEGALRYFGSSAMRLWAFVTPNATALAYDQAETPSQIRERARRWLNCLATRTAPGLASPHWGHPVYGARLDPHSGRLDVVWSNPGEWCDAVLRGVLPPREYDRPLEWALG